MEVTWIDQEREVSSLTQLDELLDSLHAEFSRSEPVLVTVELDSGDSLSIGLGQERSVLSFVGKSLEPPYYISVGEQDIDEPIAFRYGNQWSEFALRHSIPVAVARDVLRQFCRTSNLSTSIDWEDG